MKYLAILKDSLREALDSTVLYVMIALSSLVILFVATLSFKPLPAEKTMAMLVNGTINDLLDVYNPAKNTPERFKRMKDRIEAYQLKKVEVLRGEPDSPDSAYRLTIAMHFPSAETASAARQDPKEAIAKLWEQFANAREVGLISVANIRAAPEEPPDPMYAYFLADTEGTAGTRRIWFTEPSLFFGALPLGDIAWPLGMQLHALASVVVTIGSWVVILAGVVISSFFIPNMLRKGTVDLLLVKPIHRWALLLYKYVGGLTFIFINNAYAIVGIWLALGLRSGIWANWFLLLIFVLTFFFAILYAVSTLMAVLTRSTVTAILVTVGAWFVFFLVGTMHQSFEVNKRVEQAKNVPVTERRWENNAFANVVGAIHAVLPRTADLNHLSSLLILSDFMTGSWSEARKLDPTTIDWSESLLVSSGFIAILLGISCWWFSTKDY